MNLLFRGVEVPKLGSLRDVTFRKYLIREVRVEAKKHEMALLTAMTNPNFPPAANKAPWEREVNKSFNEYVALAMGYQTVAEDPEEKKMQDFYQEHVRNTKVLVKKVGRDKLEAVTVQQVRDPIKKPGTALGKAPTVAKVDKVVSSGMSLKSQHGRQF